MTGNPGPLGPNSAGMVSETTSATQVLLQHQQATKQAITAAVAQQAQMIQQWTTPVVQSVTGTNYTITQGTNDEWRKEYEVSRIVRRAKNGYFFVVSVDGTDDVAFRVWKCGLFPFLVAKVFGRFGRDIHGSIGGWNTVTKRSHLPATLGSAYEKIDAAIQADIENEDHEGYVKELLGTSPENLKMIGGLEKLAEGDVDVKDDDPSINSGSSHNVGGYTYSNNLTVSGSAQAAQPGNTLSFQNTSASTGNITGVSTLEAEKIVLNGTDLSQLVSDCVKEATDEMVLKLSEEAVAP